MLDEASPSIGEWQFKELDYTEVRADDSERPFGSSFKSKSNGMFIFKRFNVTSVVYLIAYGFCY